jgi:trehalose utilization protein
LPEDFAPGRVHGEAVAERIGSVMKMVSEDMYSMTVAVPDLTVEVSRYEWGEVLENLRIYLATSDKAA